MKGRMNAVAKMSTTKLLLPDQVSAEPPFNNHQAISPVEYGI